MPGAFYTALRKNRRSLRFHVDPSALDSGSQGGASPTTPAPNPAAPAQPGTITQAAADVIVKAHALGQSDIDSLPEHAQEYIRSLRGEAKGNRIKLQVEKQTSADATAEATRLTKEAADLEAKRLHAENQNQTIKNEFDNFKTAMMSKTITAELKLVAAQEGIPEKFLNLVDKTGVNCDESMTVSGVATAIEKFKAEYPELVKVAAPANGTPDAAIPTAPKTEGEKWADNLVVGATGMTMAQYQKLLATGGDPPPSAGSPAPKSFDARTATREQLAAEKQKMKAKLVGK